MRRVVAIAASNGPPCRTILTMTLSLVWGAILTIVITLVARGLGA